MTGVAFGHMGWIRQHIRTGTHLALFALMVQLVLALSHVHLPEQLTRHHDHAITIAHDDGHDHHHVHRLDGDAQQGHAPDTHHAHEFCALCAVALQANGMLASYVETFEAPALQRTLLAPTFTNLHLERPDAAFRSRAPPAALA